MMALTRWIVGIVGGLFVWLVVSMFVGFFLRNIFAGVKPLDTIIGFVLPIVLGLLAGIYSFKRSVWPKQSKEGKEKD